MITVFCRDCNEISQKSYDNLISSIDLMNLECPVCGLRGCLSVHGYYERSVKEPSGGKIPIRILRVKCSACGHTHAILTSSIVPYSQISLSEQNEILDLYEQGRSACAIADAVPSADENNVKAVIRKYLFHWLQRLLSEAIQRHPLPDLVIQCFSHYSRQFLQIRRTPNILFLKTT